MATCVTISVDMKVAMSRGLTFDTHNMRVKYGDKVAMHLPVSTELVKKMSKVEKVCVIGGGVAGSGSGPLTNKLLFSGTTHYSP